MNWVAAFFAAIAIVLFFTLELVSAFFPLTVSLIVAGSFVLVVALTTTIFTSSKGKRLLRFRNGFLGGLVVIVVAAMSYGLHSRRTSIASLSRPSRQCGTLLAERIGEKVADLLPDIAGVLFYSWQDNCRVYFFSSALQKRPHVLCADAEPWSETCYATVVDETKHVTRSTGRMMMLTLATEVVHHVGKRAVASQKFKGEASLQGAFVLANLMFRNLTATMTSAAPDDKPVGDRKMLTKKILDGIDETLKEIEGEEKRLAAAGNDTRLYAVQAAQLRLQYTSALASLK